MNYKNIFVRISGCVTLILDLHAFGMSDVEFASFEQQVRREMQEGRRLLEHARARQERKDMVKSAHFNDMMNIRYGTVSEKDIRRWVKEAKDWVDKGVRVRMINAGDADIAEMMSHNAVNRIDAWYYKMTGQFFEYSFRPTCSGSEQNAWDICQFVHWAFTK